MNNLMSFQDFIEKNINSDVSLDSNRENLNCVNFEFSPEKISKINEFDASVKSYKMLNQSQIEELYKNLENVSTLDQMDIKNDIFFGTKRLIHNYLVSRSKYDNFKDEPVNMMIRDGEEILWEAINTYNITMGNFSQYLFSLFAKKTVNDLNNETKTSTIKVPNSIYENMLNILSKLKGKSIRMIKTQKYKAATKAYSDSQIDSYFDGLDEYIVDVEKGKVK